MAAERQMRKQVVRGLRSLGAFSVENGVGIGTPDVATTVGWIELKHVDQWPVREGTALAVPHFTPQQRVWHLTWDRVGGKSWVLLKVADDWVLLKGARASVVLGTMHQGLLLLAAEWFCLGAEPDWVLLAEKLRAR